MGTPINPRRLGRLVVAPLLIALLCGCGTPDEFDRRELERVEDLSESLANALLRLSVAVRDRDADAVRGFFSEALRASALPADPPPTEVVVKWVQRRAWTLTSGQRDVGRESFMAEFDRLFWRFDAIDDVRFKVKHATFDAGGRGDADIAFFVVGRDDGGRREWLRGRARIEATPAGDDWHIDSFRLDSLRSEVSEVDLFSEVALPAGVSAVFPDFGAPGNEGFVSHGAAVADVDGDGLLDLAAGGVGRNFLFTANGDGTFTDRSSSSMVKFAPVGSGVLFLDYDNDGDADLFFAAVGEQVLLENRLVPDGELRFRDVSNLAGVDRQAVGFSAVTADVNGDGFPDIYVCSYNHYGSVMPNSWHRATNGTPNLLFVNRGDGTFDEAAEAWGVADSRWSYAAGFVDLDEDGDQDLYVANDFGENAFYRNDGGHFDDVAADLGIQDPGFGMGVSFGDYDNDGDLDLHVTNMSSTAGNRILERLYPEEHRIRRALDKQAAGNSLFENVGDGTFRDVTDAVGGLSGGWAFGGGFLDFDNDGREDLYTPNGFISGKSMKDT